MDKRVNGLAAVMREIAEQRDNQLRDAGAISVERLQELKAFLALQLPVETALFAAARRRDASLSLPEPRLPSIIELALVEQTRSVRSAAKPFGVLQQLVAWVNGASLPGAYRTAAAVGMAMVVTFAFVQFSGLRTAATHTSNAAPPSSIMNSPPAVFLNDAAPLTLRVSRFEVASLDPSLLTINRVLPDFAHSDRILPLDLPIRQIRLDVEAVKTP